MNVKLFAVALISLALGISNFCYGEGSPEPADPGDEKTQDKKKETEPQESQKEKERKMRELVERINQELYGGQLGERLAEKWNELHKLYPRRGGFGPVDINTPGSRLNQLTTYMLDNGGNMPQALRAMYNGQWNNWQSNPAAAQIINSGLGANSQAMNANASLWNGTAWSQR